MSTRKFSPALYATLKGSPNPATGKPYTNYDIAAHLGVDEASVRRGLRAAGYKDYLVPAGVVNKLRVEMETPVTINTAEVGAGTVTADWHHPLTDYGLVNVMLEQARALRATNWLLVAGDWFNVDYLSSFDHKQASAGFVPERLGSTATMEAVLKTYKKVIFSWGNHDARVHKALGYKVSFTDAMRMLFSDLDPALLGRIQFTNLDYVFVDTPVRGRYRVCHPKTYSQVPLTSGLKLASKHLTHVLTGHSHHAALGYDRSGKFVVGELGGLFDPNVVEYLERTTGFPNWTQGYGFISKDGHLTLESEGWSTHIHDRAGLS